MKYLKEIVKKNKVLVFVYIVSGMFIAFLKNYSADYFQRLIDRFNMRTLNAGTILIYGAVLTVLCFVNYLDEYPGEKLKHGIYLDLKMLALKKISVIDYESYETIGTGKLLQNIENGASAGKSILFDFYFCLIRELVPSVLFSMFFIYKINRYIMLAILAGYAAVFIITNLLLKALYRIKERILSNEEKLSSYLVRGFMEMVVFRVNKRFKYEIEKAGRAKNQIVDSKVKMTFIHEAFFTIFALIVIFIKVGIIAYGWMTRSITIGSVVALITLIDNAYTPIAIFNVLFVQYKLDMAAFRHFECFLSSPDDCMLNSGKKIKNISGDIAINGLSFSFGSREILKDLNLSINRGENVALVGESGSGKSTLIKIIIGLLKPQKGTVKLGGSNLSELNLNSCYDHINYISQESPVFDGTLRENIVFDKNVDDEKIIEVLKKVKLYSLYRKLNKGLDTELGEKGIMLSGGERQRLALSRLWFKDSSIVILDEATSAMDNLTEEYVMNEVINYLKDNTVIVIAHRLNSIKNFSRIIAFKDGKIAGQGTFDELMAVNPYFKKLYDANIS